MKRTRSKKSRDTVPLNLILVEYLDVPAACGKAEVIDWAPTFADLVWAPPPWDGGTPILSYIIQMKGRSTGYENRK